MTTTANSTTHDDASNYQTFLASKQLHVPSVGLTVETDAINPVLFPFQCDITRWAIRKGRCAIFADTGLGKTVMQVEWARLLPGQALIVAPLSVARQTVAEAQLRLGVTVHYTRSDDDLIDGINITNYEMIEHFDPAKFQSVVLDESSILKSLDGKTRLLLTEMFANTPYRLCCTATPAPNDMVEIGRHAEFLGIMTNAEMLAAFFVNDTKNKNNPYRLKKHGVDKFYAWLASWGMAVKRPSDLGYDDDGYILPPLQTNVVTINADYTPEGMLPGFAVGSISAIEARGLRRETIAPRIEWIADRINDSDEQWVIWCGLNNEADGLTALIPDAVNIHGGLEAEDKADKLLAFVRGETRVLITKTSIAGFGINMQTAHNMIFCGIDYSWESYYQAVRRMYRFGQQQPVNVTIVTTEQELAVVETVQVKEKEAVAMTEALIEASREFAKRELHEQFVADWQYSTDEATGDNWRLLLGDTTERIKELADNSVDLSVFSPPFVSLYTYTPTERDLGNSRGVDEFFDHFNFIIPELLRITKPGRNCCVHVQQVGATKVNDGYIGIKDFRGDVIRAFIALGWILHGEVTVDKDPQAQAIRTKAKGLLFVQLHKDSAATRPAFADYILIFQKPGENVVPIVPDVSNEEWILWARPVWYNVRETETLNATLARSDRDERHMVPLQLDTIDRCIRLWSNPGETVFDPFAGIASTLHEAIRLKRIGLGIELKPEYWRQAIKNMRSAEQLAASGTLFSYLEALEAEAE